MTPVLIFVAVLVLVFVVFWLWTSSSPPRKRVKQLHRRQSASVNDGVVIDVWPMELPRYDSGTAASSAYDSGHAANHEARDTRYAVVSGADSIEAAPHTPAPCVEAPEDDGRGKAMTCSLDDSSPADDDASASDSGGGWFEFVDDD